MAKVNLEKEDLFATKDDYLAMRQAWKDYFKAGKHKKKERFHCPGMPSTRHFKSDLRSHHHLLYAILRGRDISKGFHDEQALHEALSVLERITSNVTSEERRPYQQQSLDFLTAPFGDTVTDDMLVKVYTACKNYT